MKNLSWCRCHTFYRMMIIAGKTNEILTFLFLPPTASLTFRTKMAENDVQVRPIEHQETLTPNQHPSPSSPETSMSLYNMHPMPSCPASVSYFPSYSVHHQSQAAASCTTSLPNIASFYGRETFYPPGIIYAIDILIVYLFLVVIFHGNNSSTSVMSNRFTSAHLLLFLRLTHNESCSGWIAFFLPLSPFTMIFEVNPHKFLALLCFPVRSFVYLSMSLTHRS